MHQQNVGLLIDVHKHLKNVSNFPLNLKQKLDMLDVGFMKMKNNLILN
jgi:hypothetical protein